MSDEQKEGHSLESVLALLTGNSTEYFLFEFFREDPTHRKSLELAQFNTAHELEQRGNTSVEYGDFLIDEETIGQWIEEEKMQKGLS